MNKIARLFCVFGICTVCAPGFCADATVASRETTTIDCTEINARIAELAAIENPDDTTATELAKLQATYRSSCVHTASGRRTSGRVSTMSVVATEPTPTVASAPVETILTAYSALTEYLTERRMLCDNLAANITTLKNNAVSDDELKPLQNQYDADCTDIDKSATVDVDPETAALNMAAGLCPDGGAPNKFGCCTGETFKDLGNLTFGCCSDDGECHAPLSDGNAI